MATEKAMVTASAKDWLQSAQFNEAVKKALPSHISPERFIRVALTALMRVPKLAQCSKESIFKAMLDLSSMGLEPDGRRAHLIPYQNRNTGQLEAQLIIDYKGLIELSKRSGDVSSWRAEIVCEKDEFGWENGTVFHRIDFRKPRGAMQAVYSHVKTKDGIDDYEVMTKDQVDAIRKRSKAANAGPWMTDFDEMAKKTVIRRHSKRLTLSPEFRAAVEKDQDKIDFGDMPEMDFMPKRISEASVEIDAVEVEPTPEVAPQVEQPQEQPTEQPADKSLVTEKQITRLYAIAKSNEISKEVVDVYLSETFGISSAKELKRGDDYNMACEWAGASK